MPKIVLECIKIINWFQNESRSRKKNSKISYFFIPSPVAPMNFFVPLLPSRWGLQSKCDFILQINIQDVKRDKTCVRETLSRNQTQFQNIRYGWPIIGLQNDHNTTAWASSFVQNLGWMLWRKRKGRSQLWILKTPFFLRQIKKCMKPMLFIVKCFNWQYIYLPI